jgi:hypothetical protein
LISLADAWACTNPSAGRGLTVGFIHAVRLRDLLRDGLDDAYVLAERFDEVTEAEVTPWYRSQLAADRLRFGQMVASREGREPPSPPDDELSRQLASLLPTMALDPELFRAGLEYVGTLTPIQRIFERPEIVQRVATAMEALRDAPPAGIPGPDRAQLLAACQT